MLDCFTSGQMNVIIMLSAFCLYIIQYYELVTNGNYSYKAELCFNACNNWSSSQINQYGKCARCGNSKQNTLLIIKLNDMILSILLLTLHHACMCNLFHLVTFQFS